MTNGCTVAVVIAVSGVQEYEEKLRAIKQTIRSSTLASSTPTFTSSSSTTSSSATATATAATVGPSPSVTPPVTHSSSLPPGLDNPQKLQEALEVALRREKKYQERLGHYEKIILGLTKKYDAVSVLCRPLRCPLLRASSNPRVALCPYANCALFSWRVFISRKTPCYKSYSANWALPMAATVSMAAVAVAAAVQCRWTSRQPRRLLGHRQRLAVDHPLQLARVSPQKLWQP